MKPIYQFTIGERRLTPAEKHKLFAAIGHFQPEDKGKRVYLVDDGAGGFYSVENSEQMRRRLARKEIRVRD